MHIYINGKGFYSSSGMHSTFRVPQPVFCLCDTASSGQEECGNQYSMADIHGIVPPEICVDFNITQISPSRNCDPPA
jgi:hypothetical protein